MYNFDSSGQRLIMLATQIRFESIGNGQCIMISVLFAWILRNVQFELSGQRLILPATQIMSESIGNGQYGRISVLFALILSESARARAISQLHVHACRPKVGSTE